MVTIKFGLRSLSLEAGSTLGELLDQAQPSLRFGDNVRYMIGGVVATRDARPEAGATVTIVTEANQKA